MLSVLISACSLLLAVPLFAQHQDAGTTGFSNLKLIYSARANGMGQAMTGRVQNYDGMQFNPSSIMRVPGKSVSSTFMDHFVGSGGGSVQYVIPKNIYVTYGAFINYWNSGTIDRTEISSNFDLVETGDTFGSQNIIAGVTYAKFISPAVDFGVTVKGMLDQIDNSSASAALVDLGIMHHTVNEKIKVGLAIRNLGAQLSYYSDTKYKETLPTTYLVGMGMDLSADSHANLDIVKATGENFVGKLGVEHRIHPSFVLRGGFRSNAGDYYNGGVLAFTSGLSLGLGWDWKSWVVDYSISSYGDLGLANQLGIRYNFGN
ncbi:MAG: hypothetical protein CVU50_02415 [Candidatus Cloacimonetes bacterium HGW-Cloacimonetes-3]|jgi:hypothetical protein|nr:MAG: hypothetical protein CVU50_02415 [Candidatus Cloacimonetes bacterium HGW-Cloacimonetes-3]